MNTKSSPKSAGFGSPGPPGRWLSDSPRPLARPDRLARSARLAAGRLDFAVDAPLNTDPQVRHVKLMEDRYVCAMRKGHPLAGKDKISLDDYLAQTHVRHMVGGLGQGVRDEVLYTFEFPERPGALLQFLTSLGARWNISLFHYRNQGSDYGRVLVGMQVPRRELDAFRTFLRKLGYPYADETRNPAYKLFLV